MESETTAAAGSHRKPYIFEFSGGSLALDFANTVSGRAGPAPVDHLSDVASLIDWGEQAGILTQAQAKRMRGEAARGDRGGTDVFGKARSLRDAIFSLFSAIAAGKRPPEECLRILNELLPAALGRLRVEKDGKGFSWRPLPGEDLGEILHPVVRAGAELLTSSQTGRVRECRSDTCAWLFLDQSKNGTRCWCDMKVCGNRAKARRHYAREKAAPKAAARRGRGGKVKSTIDHT